LRASVIVFVLIRRLLAMGGVARRPANAPSSADLGRQAGSIL